MCTLLLPALATVRPSHGTVELQPQLPQRRVPQCEELAVPHCTDGHSHCNTARYTCRT